MEWVVIGMAVWLWVHGVVKRRRRRTELNSAPRLQTARVVVMGCPFFVLLNHPSRWRIRYHVSICVASLAEGLSKKINYFARMKSPTDNLASDMTHFT